MIYLSWPGLSFGRDFRPLKPSSFTTRSPAHRHAQEFARTLLPMPAFLSFLADRGNVFARVVNRAQPPLLTARLRCHEGLAVLAGGALARNRVGNRAVVRPFRAVAAPRRLVSPSRKPLFYRHAEFGFMGQAPRRFHFRRQASERIQTIVARKRAHQTQSPQAALCRQW